MLSPQPSRHGESPPETVLVTATRTARLAGREIVRRATAQREVSWKMQDGVSSIVTDADLAAQVIISEYLQSVRPGDALLSEEGDPVDPQSPRLWVVDPLDGSTNFSRGNPFWSVSIAYAERGQVQAAAVFDPFRREMFSARRGRGARLNGRPIRVTAVSDLREAIISFGAPSPRRHDYAASRHLLIAATEQVYRVRVLGSTALEICWVAAGRLEGAVNWNSHWWDVAAASLIVAEAGGAVTPGEAHWATDPTCVFSIGSNGQVHSALERLAHQSAEASGPPP